MMVLFNDGWEFSLDNNYTPVGIPHDWLIYDVNNLYKDGTGWYRKKFNWEKKPEELVSLVFDGVYMDSTVYVNDIMAGEWKYGYSSFEIDLTPFLVDGLNEVKVSVRYKSPNSRWYSGAGIYRNVWLRTVNIDHIPLNGIYVTPIRENDRDWRLEIDTEVCTKGDTSITHALYDKEGNEVWKGEGLISNPDIWDIDSPNIYTLKTTLTKNGEILQTESTKIGFREIKFSPESGFYLNGRHVKLNGVCEHHDLGCLGSAFNKVAMRRKFEILKKMGVNAVRLSHNMPARELMDLADEMGILIVSESFDMWESPKTTYDYARFFKDWYKRDVASWIRRDRNHPCVIMWSIGNEIYDTHISEEGQRITKDLLREVEKHDYKHHAPITIGSNYMPWENARKCADIVKVAGYNYSEKYYEEHHREHPDWIIYGSETASTVQSRGIYHFPYRQSVLAEDDLQCSSLGNSTTSWGARSSESCVISERDCAFSCGQFLWSGFDYIGEPTPYHTKNSYFGQIDTAGFPKDAYYIYQAGWTDVDKAPMVHIFPYWDFNEGQLIDVRICSNAPTVELFVNGKSMGRYDIDHKHGKQLTGNWTVPYHKGEIKAVAYDDKGNVVAEESRHSFGEPARIVLKPDKSEILTDGEDLIFVEISTVDEEGYPVENANNRMEITVTGAGRLVGLDNGDSTDYDEYKGTSRKLFSGKLLAVIIAGSESGEITLKVNSVGLPEETLILTALEAKPKEGVSFDAYSILKQSEASSDIPVRKITLTSDSGVLLDENTPAAVVTALISPSNATDQELAFCVVDDAGIESNIATIERNRIYRVGNSVKVTAVSDGNFHLRCVSKSGGDHVEIISQLDFKVSGLGEAYRNPYKFIYGALYNYSRGTVTNGNEKGVATARDGETQVGFTNLDFGSYGSDEITVPIFALSDDPYPIKIWEGIPGETGSSVIADVIYQKPSKWNVYQEDTWKLNKRLKGVTSICFVLNQKVHIKGFSFKKINKAFERLCTNECDHVYGDSFEVVSDGIDNIGNNVTIEFNDMDFGDEGIGKITICGNTPLSQNAVHIRFDDGAREIKQLVEFEYSKEPIERTFTLNKVTGINKVSFIFMPGSQFDFKWFRFGKN
jgi:beta-galactosidase